MWRSLSPRATPPTASSEIGGHRPYRSAARRLGPARDRPRPFAREMGRLRAKQPSYAHSGAHGSARKRRDRPPLPSGSAESSIMVQSCTSSPAGRRRWPRRGAAWRAAAGCCTVGTGATRTTPTARLREHWRQYRDRARGKARGGPARPRRRGGRALEALRRGQQVVAAEWTITTTPADLIASIRGRYYSHSERVRRRAGRERGRADGLGEAEWGDLHAHWRKAALRVRRGALAVKARIAALRASHMQYPNGLFE